KLETFRVSGNRSVSGIHIAAADPLCARRHADLISGAVIARHRARDVGPMPFVITRGGRIVATGVIGRVVDGIVPVVLMRRPGTAPPAIMSLQCGMSPLYAGI